MRQFGACSSHLSVVGGWQKLFSNNGIPTETAWLEATSSPALHLHPSLQVASSALVHLKMSWISRVESAGAQKCLPTGIRSNPLLKMQVPVGQVVASMPRQEPHSASVVSLLTLIGWQKSAVKRGGGGGGHSKLQEVSFQNPITAVEPVPHIGAVIATPAAAVVEEPVVAVGVVQTFQVHPS